jgi:chloramphenicol 3-O phosphotransferase
VGRLPLRSIASGVAMNCLLAAALALPAVRQRKKTPRRKQPARSKPQMNKGKIIILNGVSSAGKTSLSRALQRKLPEPFFWLANDSFCDMVPESFWERDQPEAEYQALSLLGKTVKLFSDEGKNVVVDTVMITVQKHDLFREYVELLKGYPVCFVHVTCPVFELQRREKERGDRSIGQAEGQLPMLNPMDGYDVVVDTYQDSMDSCVDQVMEFIQR